MISVILLWATKIILLGAAFYALYLLWKYVEIDLELESTSKDQSLYLVSSAQTVTKENGEPNTVISFKRIEKNVNSKK